MSDASPLDAELAPLSEAVDFFSIPSQTPPEAKEPKAEDEGDDQDDEEKIEKTPIAADGEPPAEAEEEEAEEKVAKPEAATTGRKKPVVVKTGREELKIPPSAKVAVTVDGKQEEVQIAELTESYTSRRENLRRFREIQGMERQIKESKEADEAFIRDFSERASKPEHAMTILGELIERAGGEPLPIIRNLRNVILENAAKLLGAAPEQVQRLKAQMQYLEHVEEANYYKEKVEKLSSDKKKIAQREQIVRQVKKVMQEFGVPDEQAFGEAFEALSELKTKKKLKVEITPEDVGGYYVVQKMIDDEFPELTDEDTRVKLFRIAREVNPTKEELRKTIRTWLGSASKSSGEAQAEEKPKQASKPKVSKQAGAKPNNLADLFL